MPTNDIGSDLTDRNPPGGDTIGQNSEDKKQEESLHVSSPQIWKQRQNLAYTNQQKMFKKWSEWYKDLYAIKTYKNIGQWRSKIFVPIMSYKVWTLVGKLLSLRPGFSVKMYDTLYSQSDQEKMQKATLKLEYDYDNPYLDESIRDRMFDSLADAVAVGTGFGLADWCTEDRKIYNDWVKKEDGTIDYSKAEATTSNYGYNDLDPINPFDVFVAPGRRSFEKKPWLIVKSRETRSEMKQDSNYDQNVVDSLKPIEKAQDPLAQYKQSRDTLIGKNSAAQDNLDDTVDAFDVWRCYEKADGAVYLTIFVEALPQSADTGSEQSKTGKNAKTDTSKKKDSQWFSVYDEKQSAWHNRYPLVPYYIRRKPHQAWGESIFETTESMAHGFNDIINQFMDNLNIVGNGGILMHGLDTQIIDFFYAPGGEIRYSGTAPTFENPTPPDTNIFDRMSQILEKGVEWGTFSDYASGTPSSPTDQTQGTKGGIIALQEAAGDIIAFMKSNYMQTLKQVGQRWLSNNRQYADPISLQTMKNGKTVNYQVTRDDFTEMMTCVIDESSMQPETPDQKVKTLGSWITQMFALQTQSFIQAGIAPPAKGLPTVPPPTDATGQPAVKPMYLDMEAIGAEVCEVFGRPDYHQFIGIPSVTDQQPPTVDSMVEKIRGLEAEGQIDATQAQDLINELEAENATDASPEPAEPAPDAEAGGSQAAPDLAQQPA